MSTLYLIPGGVGSRSDYGPAGDTPGWKCVDDPIGFPDDDATYVVTYNTITTTRDYYTPIIKDSMGIILPSMPAGVITNVIAHWRVAGETTAWNFGVISRPYFYTLADGERTVPVEHNFNCPGGSHSGWVEYAESITFPLGIPAYGAFDTCEIGIMIRQLAGNPGNAHVMCTQLYYELTHFPPAVSVSGIRVAHKKLFLGGA